MIPTWAAAVAIILFFFGGHGKLPLAQDLLTWERDTGSVENFVQVLGQEMTGQKGGAPVVVDQVWAAPEEYPRSVLWVRAEDGTWYHVYYAWWMQTTRTVGVMDVTAAESPDLTGCERLL